jgi:hypothetical protein
MTPLRLGKVWNEIRHAARETPRLYFGTVLALARALASLVAPRHPVRERDARRPRPVLVRVGKVACAPSSLRLGRKVRLRKMHASVRR